MTKCSSHLSRLKRRDVEMGLKVGMFEVRDEGVTSHLDGFAGRRVEIGAKSPTFEVRV
jgi:hypothetical protein